jgi:predicted flap endonuclease-1-like 5' DNA nuclease
VRARSAQPAPAPAAAPQPAAPAQPAAAPEARDVSHLRSVRSEALLGEGARSRPWSEVDDLKRIRGIGVLIEKKLNSLGITHYEQVANWTGADIERISRILDFKGRIERENWIEQARILGTGGQTEFSRRTEG